MRIFFYSTECDDLIMGCGENYITIWNIEFGYIVATINISEVTSPPAISDPDTLWVKCDRVLIHRSIQKSDLMFLHLFLGISLHVAPMELQRKTVPHCHKRHQPSVETTTSLRST